MKIRSLLVPFLLCLLIACTAYPLEAGVFHSGQVDTPSVDTLHRGIPADTGSVAHDTASTDSVPYRISPNALQKKVKYQAHDSIRFDIGNKKVFLFDSADIQYKKIRLKAHFIEIDWTENIITATGKTDSTGDLKGKPVFKEGNKKYRAKKIMYNYKTKKGKLSGLFTEQGKGFVHGEQVKKMPDDNLFVKGGKYTTCNYADPHYYIGINKMKAIPNELMVSGPANLVVEDVPTPLAIPFGIFPLEKGQRSGVILPEYGFDPQLGYFLKKGGFYWGINEYVDMAFHVGGYSFGSWRLGVASNYKKRYKYSGNVTVDYLSQKPFGKDQRRQSYRILWKHSQARKAHPSRNFSADVNITSGNFHNNYTYNKQQRLQSQFKSHITYRKNWLNTPFSMESKIRHEQNTRTGKMNFTLPDLALNMSRVHPFEGKGVGGRKWYEKISVSYNGSFKNRTRIYDTVLTRQLFDQPRNLEQPTKRKTLQDYMNLGAQHHIPVKTQFKTLKHINISPQIDYREYWYWQEEKRKWDYQSDSVLRKQENKFKPIRTFNTRLSSNTKLYGMFNFDGNTVQALRHVFTPRLSYNYRPDFSQRRWGYYDTVLNRKTGERKRYRLVPDKKRIYGYAPKGEKGEIALNLGNNLEMKVPTADTGKQSKKVPIFESFNVRAAYNLAADSQQMSNINFQGRTKILDDNLGIQFGGIVDPYHRYITPDSNFVRSAEWALQEKAGVGRLTRANFTVRANFQSERTNNDRSTTGSQHEKQFVTAHPEYYVDFNIPWRLNFSYNFQYERKFDEKEKQLKDKFVQTFEMDGRVNVTKNWRVGLQTGYNFEDQELTYTSINIYRNLHCWEMKLNWIPTRGSFVFTINVKSQVLQDLKLQRKKDWNAI